MNTTRSTRIPAWLLKVVPISLMIIIGLSSSVLAQYSPPHEEPGPAVERTYRLQLAALRSREAASKAWNRLRGQNRKLLGKHELEIERKDLGPPKGVYYRLLVGPATDRETARRLCAALAKRKVGCLVVQR